MYKITPKRSEPRSSGMNPFSQAQSINTRLGPDHPLLEEETLIRRPTPDELRLGAADVDVLEQDLGCGLGVRHGFGSGNLLVDMGASLLVDVLELILLGDVPVENVLLEAGNGVVGRPHALNLLTCTVGGAG